MDDVSAAILSTWNDLWPRLKKDPAELKRRLARRRMKTLRKPPRAWCLAVRASDARLTPETASVVPAAAVGRCEEHEVTLDAPLLRALCRPVDISPYGESCEAVARKLGVHKTALDYAIRQGVFRVEWDRSGTGGRQLRRRLRSNATFDPSGSSLKQRPDPVWGASWGHLADMVKDEVSQALRRAPFLQPFEGRLRFNGWKWVCPGCGRHVRTVFFPIPPVNLPEYFGIRLSDDPREALAPPPATFACVRCHGVRYFHRPGPNAWNEMIYHASGGLLYGYEVKRPDWVGQERKRQFKPHLNRAPSRRREQVLRRLVDGWAHRRIADDLGIGLATVRSHVEVIYKQHRVHGKTELRAAVLGPGAGEAARGERKAPDSGGRRVSSTGA